MRRCGRAGSSQSVSDLHIRRSQLSLGQCARRWLLLERDGRRSQAKSPGRDFEDLPIPTPVTAAIMIGPSGHGSGPSGAWRNDHGSGEADARDHRYECESGDNLALGAPWQQAARGTIGHRRRDGSVAWPNSDQTDAGSSMRPIRLAKRETEGLPSRPCRCRRPGFDRRDAIGRRTRNQSARPWQYAKGPLATESCRICIFAGRRGTAIQSGIDRGWRATGRSPCSPGRS